jgi:hypothetical protein
MVIILPLVKRFSPRHFFCLHQEMQKPPGKHLDIAMSVKLEKS